VAEDSCKTPSPEGCESILIFGKPFQRVSQLHVRTPIPAVLAEARGQNQGRSFFLASARTFDSSSQHFSYFASCKRADVGALSYAVVLIVLQRPNQDRGSTLRVVSQLTKSSEGSRTMRAGALESFLWWAPTAHDTNVGNRPVNRTDRPASRV